MVTRDQIAKEECTCNPIFLFQRGRVKIGVGAPILYDWNIDQMICTITDKPITNDEVLEEGYGWIEWKTEHVWATREEAEEWGRTHAYRYRASDGKDGRPGNEWQVFCVPCNGVLSKILLTHDIKSKTKGD